VMTCVIGWRFVAFCQVSAVVSCSAVRRLMVCNGAFARILHVRKGRLAGLFLRRLVAKRGSASLTRKGSQVQALQRPHI